MARFLITLLRSSKQNCAWHIFTVSILFFRKSFKKLFITKSSDVSFDKEVPLNVGVILIRRTGLALAEVCVVRVLLFCYWSFSVFGSSWSRSEWLPTGSQLFLVERYIHGKMFV